MKRILILLIIVLSGCSSPRRIDFHRHRLKIKISSRYDRLLDDYYRHYRNCACLPDSLAADSAALMVSRVMISTAKTGYYSPIKVHH